MGSTEPIKEQPKVVAGFLAILSVHAERLRAMQPERPVPMTLMTMVSLYSFFHTQRSMPFDPSNRHSINEC